LHFVFRSVAPIYPHSGRFFGQTESLGNVVAKETKHRNDSDSADKRKATPGSSTIMRNLNGPHEAGGLYARLVAVAPLARRGNRVLLPYDYPSDTATRSSGITETVNICVAGDVEIC
jgi:hypothetical protein